MIQLWNGYANKIEDWKGDEKMVQQSAEYYLDADSDVIYFFTDEPLGPVILDLDPEWTVFQRYVCGHVQHACCRDHLDPTCEICKA